MNVAQGDLDHCLALASRLKLLAWTARHAGPEDWGALLEEAGHLAANLETRLERAGGQKPRAVPRPAADIPLHLLDTPANRRYAEKLREAWEAGLAVDRERHGEQIGTDGYAQVIEMVLADVEREIYGPAGTGE